MKKLRYLTALLCIIIASVMLSGCGKTSSQIEAEKQVEIKAENILDVQAYTEKYFAETMKTSTYEDFVAYMNGDGIFVSKVFDNDWSSRWNQFTEEHGKVTDAVVDLTQRTAEGGYTSRIILTGEDGLQSALTISYDETMIPVSTAIAPYSSDANETLGSKMATAAGNTITGLIVVFVILVGLSLIISCFKFVNKIGGEVKPEKKDAKKSAAAAPAPAKAPVKAEKPAPAAEELDMAKNQELAAVIAAAIAAYEEKPVEGYVVRSIRRLNNNKWH
jgi:Na+-transporting methylmalonyl-CoA/oxaloacetate decarboxylase gamma subunit